MATAEHYKSMDPASKQRLDEKLKLINGMDPYNIPTDRWTTDASSYPPITYHHIFCYLVLKKSFCTSEEFGAYKGLDAFNQAYNGWVKELHVYQPPGSHNKIVKAKVLHSFRVTEKPVEPWVIVSNDGAVRAAHCTCMAGLGEVCTHVATVLFYVEVSNRVAEKETVTGRPAYWKPPCGQNSVSKGARAVNIDFTGKNTQRKVLLHEECIKSPKAKQKRSGPSADRQRDFFKNISCLPQKPVILSVVREFQADFTPNNNFPVLFRTFKNEVLLHESYDEIIHYCETLDYSCSNEQAECVEKATRGQSKSNLWFRLREGKITASKFHSVCHTNTVKPSKTVINSIVSVARNNLSDIPSVKWGVTNESIAKEKYCDIVRREHDNFQCSDCGLFISTSDSFIAASPDGIISCLCCGKGCLEVKCPHSARDMTIQEAIHQIKDFCLCIDVSGDIMLRNTHPYYYQVQCQLHATQFEFCDFFVWTSKDYFLQRIPVCKDFLSINILKSQEFFKRVVLPELVIQYFTRQIPSHDLSPQTEDVFCICRKPAHGKMIQCDGICEDWFHVGCVGVTVVPKRKWFCDSCKSKKIKRRKINK